MEELPEAAQARRVYLCPNDESIFCLVSPEDYEWAMQWKWQFTWNKSKTKRYATRSTREAGNKRVKYYMHKQILVRSGKVQPSPRHHIGDHGDGDSLNNQRGNLEYATAKQNAQNRRKKPANDNHQAYEKAA